MLAWYTDHSFSIRIMRSVANGFRIPAKHTSLFRKGEFNQEAVMYGILRGCSDIIRYNFKNKLDYLHIDLGYIERSQHTRGTFDGYYRFSLNDTQAHYKDVNLPSDRSNKLNITIKDWQDNDSGFYLIIPPTLAIETFYGVKAKDWVESTIYKLNGDPYKVRTKDDTSPLSEELKNTKCIITFNSNVALDATLAGIPTIVTSHHSVIRDWNGLTMANVQDCFEKSVNLDRKKLVNFISYHQFTLTEVEKGIAPAIIKKMREENVY